MNNKQPSFAPKSHFCYIKCKIWFADLEAAVGIIAYVGICFWGSCRLCVVAAHTIPPTERRAFATASRRGWIAVGRALFNTQSFVWV
jgi:hypothetical protein